MSKLGQAHVHFIGIGGIGMCGLAELVKNMGGRVTGSDLSENANVQRLRSLGIQVFIGHKSQNLEAADVVVFSSAVKPDNPEIREARQKGIPIIPRAEALAEIMRVKRGVAVGGTHGKTTTTSMIAALFLEAQLKPTIVVGGRLDLIKSTALLGEGPWLVAEADESDASFLKLSPEIAVITNIDNDHLDHYKSMSELKQAYYLFASLIPFYGVVVACGDDPLIRETFADFPKRILYYGFADKNDFVLKGEQSHYQLLANGQSLGEFKLNVPGRHNALNATAAFVVGLQAGITFGQCKAGIAKFEGVDRRLQFKGEVRGAKIYDDYGHHPTEVAAVLSALREKYPRNKIKVIFQPHRFSRTLNCWQQFTECFSLADEVCLLDIYAAGESALPNISSQKLAAEIIKPKAQYFESVDQLVNKMSKDLHSGDVCVTLGAGDIWKIGKLLLDS